MPSEEFYRRSYGNIMDFISCKRRSWENLYNQLIKNVLRGTNDSQPILLIDLSQRGEMILLTEFRL